MGDGGGGCECRSQRCLPVGHFHEKRTEMRLYIILQGILDFQIIPITEIMRITSETFRLLQRTLAFSYQVVHSVPPPFFFFNSFSLLKFRSSDFQVYVTQLYLAEHFPFHEIFFSRFLPFDLLFRLDAFLQACCFFLLSSPASMMTFQLLT